MDAIADVPLTVPFLMNTVLLELVLETMKLPNRGLKVLEYVVEVLDPIEALATPLSLTTSSL